MEHYIWMGTHTVSVPNEIWVGIEQNMTKYVYAMSEGQ